MRDPTHPVKKRRSKRDRQISDAVDHLLQMPPDEFERFAKQMPNDEFERLLQQPPPPHQLTYDERVEIKNALAQPQRLTDEELTRHRTAVVASFKSMLVMMREGPEPPSWPPAATKMSRWNHVLYEMLIGIWAADGAMFRADDSSRRRFINRERGDIIRMLRSDEPLPRHIRDVLANVLIAQWWPAKGSQKKQRKLDREGAWMTDVRDLIDYLAATEYQGERNPKTQAEESVARSLNVDPSSLRRMLTRYRAKRR